MDKDYDAKIDNPDFVMEYPRIYLDPGYSQDVVLAALHLYSSVLSGNFGLSREFLEELHWIQEIALDHSKEKDVITSRDVICLINSLYQTQGDSCE